MAIAALLACVTPAGAKLAANKLAANGTKMQALTRTTITQDGVSASARITTSSALDDLNGIAVETVILSAAALR